MSDSPNFKMYFANGVGTAMEWDGENLIQIQTGMTTDTPIRVDAHRYHLFLAYEGGSLQHSSTGDPYEWDVLTGAGEINVGEEITDIQASVSGALTVFAENKVAALFGDDAENWVLKTLSGSAGGKAWTAQQLHEPVYMDSRGLRTLSSTEQFGDFNIGTITHHIEPLFREKRLAGVTPVASLICREKDQYRLFWSDGTGITVYFARQPAEVTVFDLGLDITCACSGKDDNGNEVMFVGASDGYVYQIDSGTSLDGSDIDASMQLAFNHVGGPNTRKRWHKAEFEASGDTDTVIELTATYSYADAGQPDAGEQTVGQFGLGGHGDWEGMAEVWLDGFGRMISMTLSSTGTAVHELHSATIHYSVRGNAR